MKLILVCCTLFLFLSDLSFGSILLSFDDLKTLNQIDEMVEITGFLYELSDHQLILNKEPNLKSCCIKKTTNQIPHIYVLGLTENRAHKLAVTLKGKLEITTDVEMGREIKTYKLTDTKIVEKNQNYVFVIIIISLLIFFYGINFTLIQVNRERYATFHDCQDLIQSDPSIPSLPSPDKS